MLQNKCIHPRIPLPEILRRRPDAVAIVNGSSEYPEISGCVRFYQTPAGVILYSELYYLPTSAPEQIFGFHIHTGTSCSGNQEDPFADAMTHYNPYNQLHPYHAGDLPPLFGNDGYALSIILTNRFHVKEILGKAIIIHDQPDDFTTQPSGNSGDKIACGIIQANC